MAVLKRMLSWLALLAALSSVLLLGAVIFNGVISASATSAEQSRIGNANRPLFLKGRSIFRFDTFGDQAFWGGQLQLHRALEGKKLGGVGPGVSPTTALSVGLKVDATKIPASVAAAIKKGKVDLNSPKTTLALLKLNAVVGVKGFFNKTGNLASVGITCAVCHSTVDDSFAPGIGRRLDGWANRDLNVGAIIGLAPNKKVITDLLRVDEATVNKVLASWGPGKFDAELFMDGKAFRPDGKSAATLIPPAFGLAGVNLGTWTGWGSTTYWNAFVANLEMHGQGNFDDQRLANAKQFPVAARAGFAHVRHDVHLISSKLPALHFYQLALPAPRPPKGSFDPVAARRGQRLFSGKAGCQGCHMPPTYTEVGWNLTSPASICIDDFQAGRSPTFAYRTPPLKGLWTHQQGGFFHDGRFKTLRAVVDHIDSCRDLNLSEREKSDLVQFLKSR
jgi:mono/diheme cytochrome c family protein